MKRKRKPHNTKQLLMMLSIFVICTGILLVAIQLLINHFEEDLANSFIEKIEKKWGGFYSIRYDKVDVNFFMRRVHFGNLSISPHWKMLNKQGSNKIKKKLLLSTSCAVLRLENISLLKLIFKKTLVDAVIDEVPWKQFIQRTLP